MFKISGFFLAAALFLVGCGAPKPPPGDWTATPPPAVVGKPVGTVPIPEKTNAPIAPPAAAPVMTYTALAGWAARHQVAPPHRISDSPVASYSIFSTNGTLIFEIGTVAATWNGIEFNLGFDPQIVDGEVFVHGLDLQKNFEPLLCGPPLSFPRTNRVIVIDPGHGGNNPGTVSILDGRMEKEFTLDWAMALKPLLESNGWTVLLTRTADTLVTNADRVVFADQHHANAFISLHFNSTGNRDPHTTGIETYCLTPEGMASTLTRGYSDPRFADLPGNEYDEQNLQLAMRVQAALVHGVGATDRGVNRARFMTVLQAQHCPAILVEGGYLSNPRDAKQIENPDYRQKLAEAVASALK
ncbi:MAG TPA: N-acetylmuramoyl-L-alanine amidase [Verrucomicrobiae bacterium]|nr:N-acetylmuramoyl-L-alanine amidase [Verrucomicrobiae bacterium]